MLHGPRSPSMDRFVATQNRKREATITAQDSHSNAQFAHAITYQASHFDLACRQHIPKTALQWGIVPIGWRSHFNLSCAD